MPRKIGTRATTLADKVGYRLRRAQVAVFSHFNDTVASMGLRPAQFSLLELLAAQPGILQTRAGEALGIQKANFVPFLASLEERGLVERVPLDGRSNGLRLTRKGEALYRRAVPLVAAHEAAVTHGLSAAERRLLGELLDRITNAASQQKVI
jgi:DNA-binding MarR family transcriptional regulator